ncbi:hypothetical protein ACOAPY_14060 [Pseudomonas sp. P3C3]
MSLERIWRRENRRRSKDTARKERVNRNWPGHADKLVNLFKGFAEIAKRDGVEMYVDEPIWNRFEMAQMVRDLGGSLPFGETAVILRFGNQPTGHGYFERDEKGLKRHFDIELGTALVVHHSPAEGLVQVYLQPPKVQTVGQNEQNGRDSLLIDHTYNTDDLTNSWAEKNIARLLVFNRAESALIRPRLWDRVRVRVWRFLDVRNRRGYLGAFQHLFTPWELVLIAALVFAVGSLGQVLGG